MGIAVYCVGSDAARVARALSSGTRRVSCTRLPLSVELVVRCVRERAPDLVVLGGDAWKAGFVAEALAEESTDGPPVLAWDVDDELGTARLVALGVQVIAPDDDTLRRACEELLDVRDGRTIRVASDADEGSLSLHGRRVLIAEDDPAVAWYFGDVLRRVGCDVEEVHEGWAALDRARRASPDLVLADIRMPGLDGVNLCRALRIDPILGDVPVVLMSWKEDWLARARDAEIGATGFLGKHAVPEEVVERVRETLGRQVELEQRFRIQGPVRGLLGDVAPHRLLRLACASRPDCRVTVHAGAHGFEVHVRDGAPVAATRVSPDGDVLRGDEALGALLDVRAGRFVVTIDRVAVEAELTGTLPQQVAPHVARVRQAGPRPMLTPSIPIVVASTESIRLASPPDPSLPMPLLRKVQKVAPAAPAPVAPRRRSRVEDTWRALVRTVALLTLASLAVGLGVDTRAPRATQALAVAAPDAPPMTPPTEGAESVAPSTPGTRAARTPAPHPR
jgi:CheY-like chemotaxis protein